jgi:hypothetical protein
MNGQRSLPLAAARAMWVLHLDMIAAEAVGVLRNAGIPSILLKGPALARWLYDDVAERPYVDVDLLVPASRMAGAEDALTGIGLRRAGLESIKDDWPRHAVVFRTDEGAAVDLHRTLMGVGVEDDRLWAALSSRTQQMSVAGTMLDVLVPSARALVVVLHAAKDGRRVAKTRTDLERCLSRVEIEMWPEVAELASDLQAKPAFEAGLRLVPAGEALADRLGLSGGVPVDVAIRATGAPPLAVGIDWLLTSRGVRGKIGLVFRKLFPPAEYLREWKPLARKGTWGLALAYVWRPIWVAAHVFPAMVAVVRAHRAATRSAPPP